MDTIKKLIENYLPKVETFLTSVLLEETDVEIAAVEIKDADSIKKGCQKDDIYIYANDEQSESDIILILDPVWYGLLSSIMLGVEEKTNNEITRDLLKKFSKELVESLADAFKEANLAPSFPEFKILTTVQLEKELTHAEYFHAKLDVDGLADFKVRAELILGNPEAKIEQASVQDQPANDDKAGQTEFKSGDGKAKHPGDVTDMLADDFAKEDTHSERIITAKSVEFEEFVEQPLSRNGDTSSMDLLKDVEMDVSVELGRIELPLGKVLELSKGSVIELDKLAGEPVDLLVNGHYIAKGEVVVIDEHFGIRISSLVTTRQRLAGIS